MTIKSVGYCVVTALRRERISNESDSMDVLLVRSSFVDEMCCAMGWYSWKLMMNLARGDNDGSDAHCVVFVTEDEKGERLGVHVSAIASNSPVSVKSTHAMINCPLSWFSASKV
mmetsp:Transcript_63586/g.101207  ORF Transcript_63586/g.101207 Transcript_63586/m.101207 type:complete len:114 (-) Transcript_63586:32-373(-)